MTLLNPLFLQVGLALTVLALFGLWSHEGRRRRLARFLGGQRAVDRVAPSNLLRLRIERALLLGIAGFAAALAAAEPRRTASLVDVEPPGPRPKEVVIAIDVSASMQASDEFPTRLAKAVEVAGGLLDALEGHRVGLLLYAGTSYPLAPPTDDHQALRFILSGVVPTVASAQDPGSLLSIGIDEGLALLRRSGGESPSDAALEDPSASLPGAPGSEAEPLPGAPAFPSEAPGEQILVLIGDGEAGESEELLEQAIASAAESGVVIHTVGVGTTAGSGMIMPRGRYQLGGAVVDARGERGVSHLEESRLRLVAEEGGGTYAAAADPSALERLGATLQEAGAFAEAEIEAPLPFWRRYDIVRALGVIAFSFLLLESLLDVFATRAMSRMTRRAV